MFSLPYMRIIVPVIGIMAVFALGAYTYFTLKQAQYFYTGPVTISVTGEGEAIAVPDIATFSFSVGAEGDDAATAQDQSAERVNAIMTYLAEEGVEERDIKTEYYTLNPRYEYLNSVCTSQGYCPPGERVLRGFEVTQSVQVKVRATDTAGDLISGVGALGATNVSGLQFTTDDDDALIAEARADAIADAKEKAGRLAESLGVRIVRMNGFWEDQGSYPYNAYGGDTRMESSAVMDSAGSAPSLPTGENVVSARVNISYEVK